MKKMSFFTRKFTRDYECKHIEIVHCLMPNVSSNRHLEKTILLVCILSSEKGGFKKKDLTQDER